MTKVISNFCIIKYLKKKKKSMYNQCMGLSSIGLCSHNTRHEVPTDSI